MTPDTILRWHRELIALTKVGLQLEKKAEGTATSGERDLRSGPSNGAGELAMGLHENQGALATLGHQVSRGTVGNILRAHGIEPAHERSRRTPWLVFLKSHLDTLAATDVFTVEIARPWALETYYVLFVIDLSTRRVHVAGIMRNPDGAFMLQIARNLTDVFDGFLLEKRYLILDRDGKYTKEFRDFLTNSGTNIVRLPARSSNLNAYAERFVLSIKIECLDRMIFFTQASLRKTISSYLSHYHRERCHQGLGNRLIEPEESARHASGRIRCRERLGGLLRYYYRDAASNSSSPPVPR